jgi:hypothetical protein
VSFLKAQRLEVGKRGCRRRLEASRPDSVYEREEEVEAVQGVDRSAGIDDFSSTARVRVWQKN